MKAAPLTDTQLVTIAVYLLGGERHFVDTEDVAVKANGLAPGRYLWRKYKDQINLELIRVFLSDAKKPKNGILLQGSGSKGWMLTERGRALAARASRRLDRRIRARTPMTWAERKRQAKERRRLMAADAYAKFVAGSEDILPRDAEAFFRVDEYVRGDARLQKIDRILTMFGNDKELGPAVRAIAEVLRRPPRGSNVG